MDTLLTLSEQFSDEAIKLHPERCLNTRFRAVDCTRCADGCPAEGAIVINEGKPALDNEECLHCGLCLHYCPTGAFSRPDGMSGKLIKIVATFPPGPVDLVCPQHPASDRGRAPLAVQTKRCLAALSPATLLELSTQGNEIWLDDTPCADCPLGKIHSTLEETVAEANGWGSLLENTASISLHTWQDETLPAIQRPVCEVDQPLISRRDLFSSFKQLGQEAAALEENVELVRAGKSVPVSERLPQSVPRQRAKILAIINRDQRPADPQNSSAETESKSQNLADPRMEAKSKVELPVADLTINTGLCSACGLCARFCPTGALTFLSDEEQFVLGFQPTLCLGERCNICMIACPEKAVSIKPAAISSDLFGKKPRCLAAGDLIPCQKCGVPIAKGPELAVTCFVCRSRGTEGALF